MDDDARDNTLADVQRRASQRQQSLDSWAANKQGRGQRPGPFGGEDERAAYEAGLRLGGGGVNGEITQQNPAALEAQRRARLAQQGQASWFGNRQGAGSRPGAGANPRRRYERAAYEAERMRERDPPAAFEAQRRAWLERQSQEAWFDQRQGAGNRPGGAGADPMKSRRDEMRDRRDEMRSRRDEMRDRMSPEGTRSTDGLSSLDEEGISPIFEAKRRQWLAQQSRLRNAEDGPYGDDPYDAFDPTYDYDDYPSQFSPPTTGRAAAFLPFPGGLPPLDGPFDRRSVAPPNPRPPRPPETAYARPTERSYSQSTSQSTSQSRNARPTERSLIQLLTRTQVLVGVIASTCLTAGVFLATIPATTDSPSPPASAPASVVEDRAVAKSLAEAEAKAEATARAKIEAAVRAEMEAKAKAEAAANASAAAPEKPTTLAAEDAKLAAEKARLKAVEASRASEAAAKAAEEARAAAEKARAKAEAKKAAAM